MRSAAPDRAGQAQPERPSESFNGQLRNECLNEHWFTSLTHARTVIGIWRREYN